MAVHAGKDGSLSIPDGWNITGVLDPALKGVMKQFIQNRKDADEFNNGKMVIIANTNGTGPNQDWIVVEKKFNSNEFQAPAGFNIVEMDESTLGNTCQK